MNVAMLSLATANPPLYVTQEEALRVFTGRFRLTRRERVLYGRILRNGPIKGRYVGMDSTAEAAETDQDRLILRFTRFGRSTAAAAARKALKEARVKPSDVGAVVVNTCTGYICPGLTSHLAETLGLSKDIRPLDIMGMGCGAAIPCLETAANIAAAMPGRAVLAVSVEICSATLFMDPDPGVVVSNCIFGDGAAAAVIRCESKRGRRGLLRFRDFASALHPEHRDSLHYRTENHRLRNVLTPRVPSIGARTVGSAARRVLKRAGLGTDDIDWWAVHPGGTEVIARVSRVMGLGPEALASARHVFERYGNMSSPGVLFVLRRILDEHRPRRGDRGMMLSFGAGFSAYAALVEF